MRRRVSPLDAAFSLVADLLGSAGIAARFAVDTLRLLVAQTGSHELLTRATGHALRLSSNNHSALSRQETALPFP
jgi:hypothetical protein